MQINLAVEQFQNLVNNFVNHKDFTTEGNKAFKEKQKLLIAFSQTFNALVVSLMALEKSDEPNTIYFASQFVKDKLKFQFEQLSPEAVVETHTRIINIIRTKTNINKIVTSNLALCLSFLYIHCYDKLGTAFDFFKNTFSSGSVSAVNGNLYYQYLFRYLDGLACEVDSRRLVIDEMKRNQVHKSLKSQQMEIVLALHNIYSELSKKGSDIKLSISDYQNLLFSFSEWIRIEDPPKEITQEIHNHSVFRLAVESLSDPTLTQAAAQCLLAAIEIVKNPQDNNGFYDFMGNNLSRLLKCVNQKIEEQDYDEAENYVKVLCQYGIHAGKNLVQKFNQISLLFVQQMTKITEDPIMQVFKQLVDFWQSMIYFITNRSQSSPLTKPMATQIIGYLYQIFVNRIRYNPTQIHQLDQLTERQLAKLHQSIEDVRDRRECARYIFECIAKFLGYDIFLKEVLSTLGQLDTNDDNYWGKVQSFIYSLRDVAKSFVQPTPQLCQLVLFFESILQKHIMVKKTILRVYGSLQSMQEKNQQFILKVLVHTTSMLEQPLLAEKAGETFIKCCEQNGAVLVKHIASLYQLLNKHPEKESILVGITHILKKYPNLLTTHLPQIIKGPLSRLQSSKSKKEKRNQFNKLFTIIECVPKGETKSIADIIEMLLKAMWPIVSQILLQPEETNCDQDRLIERAVKFLKLVMRSIPDEFTKYLKDIFQVVLQAYKKYPINSYLYLFEVTFTVYYKSCQSQIVTYLKTLYQEYCRITYLYLNNTDAIATYQHLVDDFIGLNKRIVTFHTKIFLESGQVKPILEFSTHCLGSKVPRIASSASQLFQIIFMIYWSAYSRKQYENEDKGEVVAVDPQNSALYAELKVFILPSIPNLLRNMFKFLETGPVESARNNILDCFEAIALAYPKQSKQLWNAPLSELAEDILTVSEKQRLKQNLLKLGSEVHLEFLNAQQVVNRLLLTISNRYLYRQSRANSLTNK